jgi:hypothetical protein
MAKTIEREELIGNCEYQCVIARKTGYTWLRMTYCGGSIVTPFGAYGGVWSVNSNPHEYPHGYRYVDRREWNIIPIERLDKHSLTDAQVCRAYERFIAPYIDRIEELTKRLTEECTTRDEALYLEDLIHNAYERLYKARYTFSLTVNNCPHRAFQRLMTKVQRKRPERIKGFRFVDWSRESHQEYIRERCGVE